MAALNCTAHGRPRRHRVREPRPALSIGRGERRDHSTEFCRCRRLEPMIPDPRLPAQLLQARVTVLLIALNVLVFLFEFSLDPFTRNDFIAPSASSPTASTGCAVLTSMFLHGGWMHLHRQHALPLGLRRQHRGHPRPRASTCSSTCSAALAAAMGQYPHRPRFARPHGRRQRRHRRRHGRLHGQVPPLPHRPRRLVPHHLHH